MIMDRIPELGTLTPREKLELVGELWDELAANPADIPVPPEHIAELERRMEEYRRDPTKVTSWEAAKKRILASRQ
jgi:putative addiction module component (TIGR02574 family)